MGKNATQKKENLQDQNGDVYFVNSEMTSAVEEDIDIIVGGTTFTTKMSTLQSVPGSTLASLCKASSAFCPQKQAYCFDRDPDMFKHILNAHRQGELHVPSDICAISFRSEMKFWKIPHRMLAPCCWRQFYSIDDDLDTIHTLIQNGNGTNTRGTSQVDVMGDHHASEPTGEPLPRLWLFLEEPNSSKAAKIWCFFYIMVVITSVITFIIWLEPSVRVKSYLPVADNQEAPPPGSPEVPGAPSPRQRRPDENEESEFNEKLILIGYTDPHPVLLIIDSTCTFFFIVETIVHFCACPHKSRYYRDPYNITRIFLTFTMTLSFILEMKKDLVTSAAIGKICIAIKGLNILRLLLIMRLRKVYNGLNIMMLSLERSMKEFMLLMFVFVIAVIIYGGMIFCMEIDTDMFPSTVSSMWWAIITMTTVGYGDYYPTHTLGYIVGLVCAINGLVVIALPVAAIASNFSGLYARNEEIQRHRDAVKHEEVPKEIHEKESKF